VTLDFKSTLVFRWALDLKVATDFVGYGFGMTIGIFMTFDSFKAYNFTEEPSIPFVTFAIPYMIEGGERFYILFLLFPPTYRPR